MKPQRMYTVETVCHSNDESRLNGDEGKPRSFSILENFPRSRTKHSSCLSSGHLYVFGGRDGTVGLKDSWRYNIERYSWEKLEIEGDQLPYLEDHSSVAIGKKIIIFGGNFENRLSSHLWFIDISDFKCKSVDIEDTPVPLSRRGHTCCSYGDDLYIFGGFLDFLGCTDELWRLSSVHTKSPKWELLCSGQNSFKSFSQKNIRLSPDGSKFSMQTTFAESFLQSQSGVGPSPRSYQASAILRDDMYIHGGERGHKILASFWRWNFITGSWLHLKSKPSPPPLKRHNMVAASPTTLLVLGRETSSDFIFWGFNVNTSTWFKLADQKIDNFKIDLVGFVALNISEINDFDDGLSLVTLWDGSDTTSTGNVTEITDFSCSVGIYPDDPCLASREFPHYFSEDFLDIPTFHESHKEAARKLSRHRPVDTVSALVHCSSPLKAPIVKDIEMEHLDDKGKLLPKGCVSEISFENICFDFDENSLRKENLSHVPDIVVGMCRSEGFDNDNIDLSLAPRMRKMKRERKCHLPLALVGGKKNKRQLASSPLSIILLTCDPITFKVNDIYVY